jgi:OOP family OmpA-OmpF porin
MNFNEIKNRLLIGALAITVFPFYVHAQNDKMEGQTAHRTKAWEIGVGGALIN